MRTIEWTARFKRDYKREAKGKYSLALADELLAVLDTLSRDQALDQRCRDHGLNGEWIGCRDCHVKPDLILIYEKPDEARLVLMRLGSHSELFG